MWRGGRTTAILIDDILNYLFVLFITLDFVAVLCIVCLAISLYCHTEYHHCNITARHGLLCLKTPFPQNLTAFFTDMSKSLLTQENVVRKND